MVKKWQSKNSLLTIEVLFFKNTKPDLLI
jgi:hypothetical protein